MQLVYTNHISLERQRNAYNIVTLFDKLLQYLLSVSSHIAVIFTHLMVELLTMSNLNPIYIRCKRLGWISLGLVTVG